MAKSFRGKGKKAKVVKFDAITGKSGNTAYSLDYNKISKRYDLRSEDGFFYSHISVDACENKAVDKEVVWS